MKRRLLFAIIAAVSLINTLLFMVPLGAQSIWVDQSSHNSIAIEILKPHLDGDENFTFISSAWFLSGRFWLGENVVIMGELPLAYGALDENFGFDEDETIIGNPYIGLELRKQGSPVYAEIGGRIPLTPDDKFLAPTIGSYSDLDRLEAFASDVITLTAKMNYHQISASNLAFRIRGGPTFWINTGGNGDDSELLLDYSAQVGYEGERITVLGGLTGRLLVTEGDLDLGERTFHQLGVAASVGLGTVRPGVHLRFPIDEDSNDLIDFVLGFNLAIEFK
ncbi:MAG: hypothetical protein ACE5IW_04730 [bacterium]